MEQHSMAYHHGARIYQKAPEESPANYGNQSSRMRTGGNTAQGRDKESDVAGRY